jgi:hemin uptake protein HemP
LNARRRRVRAQIKRSDFHRLPREAYLESLQPALALINANDYHYDMNHNTRVPADAPRPSRSTPSVPLPRRIRSRELFGPSFEVRIDHDGVEYRLTRTRQGKLILTK